MSWCVKVNTLGRLYDDDLERSYIHFTTINIYSIGAAYNFYFLIIYKPSFLIISPQTFSMQLGAGTAWCCLSQCAIPFCTLSPELTVEFHHKHPGVLRHIWHTEFDNIFHSKSIAPRHSNLEGGVNVRGQLYFHPEIA